MLDEKGVFAQFNRRGTLRGGELYLPLGAALDLIRVCEENGLTVVGVEGFVIDGGKTAPLMDAIGDFSGTAAKSWEEYRRLNNGAAEVFLKNRRPDDRVAYSVTVLSEPEWHR